MSHHDEVLREPADRSIDEDLCPVCRNPVCAASARGISAGMRQQLMLTVHPSADVIKPAHYMVGDLYEHVRVVDAWGLSYQLGCATKYLARAGKKDKAKHEEDLRKAIRYIELEIERIKKGYSS